MSILLSCACGKRLRVPDQNAGKKVRCPGCGAVLTVPHPPEKIEIIEAEAVPEEVVASPPRSTLRPPPVPIEEDSHDAKPRRELDCQVVKLTPVDKTQEGPWYLEMDEEEVRLIDDEDEVVCHIDADEANHRIQFPSFWMNVKYLQILHQENLKNKLLFQPEPKVIKRVRAYLDDVLRRDPGARRKFKQRALGILAMGLLGLIIGSAVLAYLVSAGFYDRRGYRGIGITIAGIGGGLIFTVMGIALYIKAARIERQAQAEE